MAMFRDEATKEKMKKEASKGKGIRRFHFRRPCGASLSNKKKENSKKTGDMTPVPIKINRIQ